MHQVDVLDKHERRLATNGGRRRMHEKANSVVSRPQSDDMVSRVVKLGLLVRDTIPVRRKSTIRELHPQVMHDSELEAGVRHMNEYESLATDIS